MKGSNKNNLPDVLTFEQLRGLGVGLLARDRLAFEKRWRSIKLTDMMNIVYTSGTTGRQKGAVHTPVSYTHLDVYKRQTLKFTKGLTV